MLRQVLVLCIFLVFWKICDGNYIVGIKCTNGLVLGCDNYYVNPASPLIQVRDSNSLFQINDKLIIGFLSQRHLGLKIVASLKKVITKYRLLYGKDLSISSIAKYARQLIYYKYPDCSLVLAGMDPSAQDEERFSLYHIADGGSLFSQEVVSLGRSGNFFPLLYETLNPDKSISSAKADGSFDPFLISSANPKEKLTVEEAIDLIQKNIHAAMRNDHTVGGSNPRFVLISEKGIKFLDRKIK